jgi:uncharacterized repeat protein (TIGR03837 family)
MARHWDLFCRVIDNFGDLGVCWRLARQLAARGERVRLWVDEPLPTQWLACDHAASSVQVVHWSEPAPALEPGDVVIEAFGCNPPQDFVARMAARDERPCWINLEYLSAEPYVERCHGLPSPQRAAADAGLRKWFFYPGFTPHTGGLLREPRLGRERAAFDAPAWLRSHDVEPRNAERRVSVFCYDGAPLRRLTDALADRSTMLLLTPGPAQQLAGAERPEALRRVDLPWLGQDDYDRLLWTSQLNIVRGEDSFVRAQWAGAPFIWHIYAQHDGAHVAKLEAFLAMHLAGAEATLAGSVGALWRAWNGLAEWPAKLPDESAWRAHALGWRDRLERQAVLLDRLLRFVDEKR